MPRLAPTPAQTIGPFFGFALPSEDGPRAVPAGTAGAIRVGGTVYDGAGEPVPDALIETWQANPEGRFAHPDDPRGAVRHRRCDGFARCPTDDAGRYSVLTLKPGPVPGPGGTAWAPHLAVSIFARGLLHRLVTRAYFGDEEEANAADPLLCSLAAEPAARDSLIAAAVDDGYRFDIRLQAVGETVFLAV